jgi:hypothetical protein
LTPVAAARPTANWSTNAPRCSHAGCGGYAATNSLTRD